MKEPLNPKDIVGSKKIPFSSVPAVVIAEIALGMYEGARKYGRHNYRIAGVRPSIYYDATLRHLMAWWEGEDIDPDSGLHHVTKALASLTVLRDAMINGKIIEDDRPPSIKNKSWLKNLNKGVEEIVEKYPDMTPPYTINDTEYE